MGYCSLMVKRLTVNRSLLKLDFNFFGQRIMFESFSNPPLTKKGEKMVDYIKKAEENCINIAKNMTDMLEVIRALEIFGGRFLDQSSEELKNYGKGTRLIRDAIYAKYIKSINDCFLFAGVGGKKAEEFSREKFKKLFGKKEYAIMNLLDKYGKRPNWYKVNEEKEFRKQAIEKLEGSNDENP